MLPRAMNIARLALAFGRQTRATYHEDGIPRRRPRRTTPRATTDEARPHLRQGATPSHHGEGAGHGAPRREHP